MKKTKNFILANIFIIISIVLGAVSLVFLAGTGLIDHVEGGASIFGITINGSGTSTIPLAGLIFGSAKITTVTTVNGSSSTSVTQVGGGMSYFGLFSFLAVLLALVVAIVTLFIKNKWLSFVSGILFLVGAILMLVLKEAGTAVTYNNSSTDFFSFFNGYKLGYAPYLYSVASLLGGFTVLFAPAIAK